MFKRSKPHGADAVPHVRPRQLRARAAWSEGATAFQSGDWTTAIQQFSAAARADNGMTDAWLGLHAAGHEKGHSLLQLQSNSSRLGEEQQRTGITIESRFSIGPYVNVPLRSVYDIWAATAADYLDAGMYQHAQRLVMGFVPGAAAAPDTAGENFRRAIDALTPTGRYLAGRLEFSRGDVPGTLYALGPVTTGQDALAVSALIMTGTIQASQGHHVEAMASFDTAVVVQASGADISPALAAEALLQSSYLANNIGDEADARDRVARATQLYPHLPGLQHQG